VTSNHDVGSREQPDELREADDSKNRGGRAKTDGIRVHIASLVAWLDLVSSLVSESFLSQRHSPG
jgi:hypothetical protein